MTTLPSVVSKINPSEITTAYTLLDIQKALGDVKKEAIFFVDVDDNLITPESNFFRADSPYRTFIDELKKNRDKVKNFEAIVSHWRLTRRIMLVESGWPALIETWKAEGHPVFALTKMDTGTFGAIPSMEKWRYNELINKGFQFTPTYKGVTEATVIKDAASPATFYKGIFMTGSLTKGDVIRAFLQDYQPSQIVFIDDRRNYVEEVAAACAEKGIPFIGILFRGVERLQGHPDPDVAEFQKQQLLEGQWLEDASAKEQLLRRAS